MAEQTDYSIYSEEALTLMFEQRISSYEGLQLGGVIQPDGHFTPEEKEAFMRGMIPLLGMDPAELPQMMQLEITPERMIGILEAFDTDTAAARPAEVEILEPLAALPALEALDVHFPTLAQPQEPAAAATAGMEVPETPAETPASVDAAPQQPEAASPAPETPAPDRHSAEVVNAHNFVLQHMGDDRVVAALDRLGNNDGKLDVAEVYAFQLLENPQQVLDIANALRASGVGPAAEQPAQGAAPEAPATTPEGIHDPHRQGLIER